MIGPALTQMDVPPLAAHLFIFYFGILSAITPPNCIASFTAAAIAQANPWSVAWKAYCMALPVYLMPFLFVYNPALIMRGMMVEILITLLIMAPAVWAICGGLTGYFLGKTNPLERALAGIGGVLLAYPSITTRLVGGVVMVLLAAKQLRSWPADPGGQHAG